MQLNGWRPVTSKYPEIGVNVSPASNLASNVAPLHPVLNKLQEHMAASERQKARKPKPQDNYSPPSILGSFSVFGHATKARGEGNGDLKHEPKATKEYSFLIPPPRDAFRFEVDTPKKLIFRESDPYVRQTQFVPQVHKPGPTYYVKTNGLTAGAQKNRPVVSAYNVQSFIPSLHSPKEFESLKVINDNSGNDNKHVLQYPKTSAAPNYAKDGTSERNYNRYQSQSQATVGSGTFYSPNYKTTYERDPSYLVHESHEVGYATPSYDYKYRQPGIFDGYLNPDLYGTTPRPEINKYPIKPLEKKEKTVHPTYYVAEPHREFVVPPAVWQMKQALKSDINEVLPKLNRPAQFHQQSPIQNVPQPPQKLVYVRPELQQQQKQSYSSIIPININQRPPETDYETPESLSLKHYNDQQFMLQQQLIEQDRRRLREHELQRQKVLERQQIEEINKKQEELRLLEQQQHSIDEADLKKHVRRPDKPKISKIREGERSTHAPRERAKPEQVTTETSFNTEPNFPIQQGQYEVTRVPEEFFTTQRVNTLEEKRQEFRPSRPAKPLRRRKPSYDHVPPTEYPTENPTVYETYTEIPVQTTTWEPVSTTTVPTSKIRPRKPSGGELPRRRRPSTTTPEPETAIDTGNEEFLKYDRPHVPDVAKRRRINKPATSYDEPSGERKSGLKKGITKLTHVNAETTTEVVTESDVRPSEPEIGEKPVYFNNEHALTESPQVPLQDYQVEGVTDYPKPGIVYANPEGAKLTKFEYYEPTGHEIRTGQYAPQSEDNIPLEHLFVRTEQSTLDTTTTPSVSTVFYSGPTMRTTVKISKSQEQSKGSIAVTTAEPPPNSTKAHHRIRPLRYGNATRPRFSVKEYKSRLDYKNKLMQATSSSTEASTRQKSKGGAQQGGENFRESPGRYR